MSESTLSVNRLTPPGSGSLTSVKSPEQDGSRAFWKNSHQHLFFFLGYCVNMRSFNSFIYEDAMTNPESVPSLIQIVLVCVIIAGPLIFIQHFIGQFTQKGCIAIGAMLPAMYGFGFCMLMVALLDCVQTLYYAGASLFYIPSALLNFPYPAWMHCSGEIYEKYPTCFSREDIDLCQTCDSDSTEPCFPAGKKILSAKLFRIVIAFEKDETVADLVDMGEPQTKSLTHIFITILCVYFISCRKLKSLDWSLRLSLTVCFLSVTVSLVLVFSHAGVIGGFRRLLQFNIQSTFSVACWVAAFRRVTEALKISSGGHVLLGSYMTADTPSHFRVCFLIGYYLLIVCFYHMHYYLVESLLQCKLNTDKYGVSSADDITFVMYPTELGLAATPQLWGTLHFTVYWILSVVSMVMQIVLADETLGEELKISNYYKYTRCCMCAIIFLFSVPLTTKGGMLVARVLRHELKLINLFVIAITFIILFLYNLQRLNDDIHFVLNVPPTWYIQTCWILSAFIAGSIFMFQTWQYKANNKFYLVRIILYTLIGVPILVGFVIKMIHYIKSQNITGMFRPSVYYGAPDINTRMLRLLYNPRYPLKWLPISFFRLLRVYDVVDESVINSAGKTCKHRCLLNNEIAAKAIEKELTLLQQIALDLQNTEEYKGEYSDVISTLQEHYYVIRQHFAAAVEQLHPTKKVYV